MPPPPPLQEHILPQPRAYYRVDPSAEPDLWLDAVQVWEVKCADLSLSPVHKAALGMVSSAGPRALCRPLLEVAPKHHRACRSRSGSAGAVVPESSG